MTDIVERLRGYKEQHPVADDLREAADEIESLREQLATVRELREYDAKEIGRLLKKVTEFENLFR